jgi:hypothetical protein
MTEATARTIDISQIEIAPEDETMVSGEWRRLTLNGVMVGSYQAHAYRTHEPHVRARGGDPDMLRELERWHEDYAAKEDVRRKAKQAAFIQAAADAMRVESEAMWSALEDKEPSHD